MSTPYQLNTCVTHEHCVVVHTGIVCPVCEKIQELEHQTEELETNLNDLTNRLKKALLDHAD